MKRLELQDNKQYINRLGKVVTVWYDGNISDYPYADAWGKMYSSDGKIYKGKESEFDLVEEFIFNEIED